MFKYHFSCVTDVLDQDKKAMDLGSIPAQSTTEACSFSTGVVNEASKKLFTAIRLKLQEIRKKQHSGHGIKPIIDLDTCLSISSNSENPTKWWLQDLHLLDSDKEIISTGRWINAAIINASQYILNKQFSNFNFQDVGCGLTMCFSIVQDSFIQVLHDCDRNHWLTISNINSDHPEIVNVYDSMFSYSSSSLRAQVASLLHTDKPNFVLNFVDVHKQNGHDDCGIFSIAYAVALCMGMHPGTLMFEQNLMRHHLISCLQLFKFSTFPIKNKRRRNLKIRSTENIKVFCICRMPDIPHQPDMICCSSCATWFHAGVCIDSVPTDAWNKRVYWCCPSCA